MEMHQVRYFLAVVEERNFTKAAALCNVSPPSLLRAVKILEHEFGGRLFNRERAKTHLTELGRIALPHLEQIAANAVEAKAKARKFSAVASGALKLGVMCTIRPEQFVPLIAEFRKSYPGIELKLLDGSAGQLEKLLLLGELEMAIYASPSALEKERIHTLPLFREQMFVALPDKHSLAKRKSIAAAALNGEPYLERINCEFAGVAEKAFEDRGVEGPTIHSSDREDWILAMVAAGFGYGFLPQSSVTFPGVVARPLIEPEFWRTVNLVTVRGRPHSPSVGAFVRAVMSSKWQGKKALAISKVRVSNSSESAPS
jgi:LysR family transcriptional regulator, hydrogen peroxide-inducible genes activator